MTVNARADRGRTSMNQVQLDPDHQMVGTPFRTTIASYGLSLWYMRRFGGPRRRRKARCLSISGLYSSD